MAYLLTSGKLSHQKMQIFTCTCTACSCCRFISLIWCATPVIAERASYTRHRHTNIINMKKLYCLEGRNQREKKKVAIFKNFTKYLKIMQRHLQKLYHSLQGNSPCQSAFEYPCKINNNKKSFQNMLATTLTMN